MQHVCSSLCFALPRPLGGEFPPAQAPARKTRKVPGATPVKNCSRVPQTERHYVYSIILPDASLFSSPFRPPHILHISHKEHRHKKNRSGDGWTGVELRLLFFFRPQSWSVLTRTGVPSNQPGTRRPARTQKSINAFRNRWESYPCPSSLVLLPSLASCDISSIGDIPNIQDGVKFPYPTATASLSPSLPLSPSLLLDWALHGSLVLYDFMSCACAVQLL